MVNENDKERRRSIRYRVEGKAPSILVMSGDLTIEGVISDISVTGAAIRIDPASLDALEKSGQGGMVRIKVMLEDQEQEVKAKIIRRDAQSADSVLCVHLEESIFNRDIMESLLKKYRAGAIVHHGETLLVLGTLTAPLAEEMLFHLGTWGIRVISLNSCFEIEKEVLPVLKSVAGMDITVRGFSPSLTRA